MIVWYSLQEELTFIATLIFGYFIGKIIELLWIYHVPKHEAKKE